MDVKHLRRMWEAEERLSTYSLGIFKTQQSCYYYYGCYACRMRKREEKLRGKERLDYLGYCKTLDIHSVKLTCHEFKS